MRRIWKTCGNGISGIMSVWNSAKGLGKANQPIGNLVLAAKAVNLALALQQRQLVGA
jgi:hypothetical protein